MKRVRYILLSCVLVAFAAESIRAQGAFDYTDDFSTDKARYDCYTSSIFWPRDINCPPARPYLFYCGTGDARGLAFMDYGEELAQLGYKILAGTPSSTIAVRGTLVLDVSFPCNAEISQFPPGQLYWSKSSDGMDWSTPEPLLAGHHQINIQSPKGTCYFLLAGARVVIDNLRFTPPQGVTTRVSPPDALSNTVNGAGQILHVDGHSGRDSNNGLSRASAFATIQKAINEAQDGDTVVVWPGVYQEEIGLEGKSITVQSASDAAVITAPHGYAISFFRGEGAGTIVANFVIAGCGMAGIFCDSGSSPTLRNLTITGNQQAGIIAYGGANPYIVNSIIWANAKGSLSAWKDNFPWQIYYSCIDQSNPNKAAGNFRADPKFADSKADPKSADYHLKSQWGRYVPATDTWVLDSTTSPCIDAGDPTDGPRGERVPNGVLINVGAHGGTPYASLSSGPQCK